MPCNPGAPRLADSEKSTPYVIDDADVGASVCEPLDMAPTLVKSSSAEHPAALLGSVSVVDGLRVGLRLARPSDAPRVRAFLERLSSDTRRRRFGTPQPRVSSSLVRHFVFPDPRRRMIVVATAPLEGTERIVGIADSAFVGPETAEIAFVVADELQGRGLGHLLAQAAAAIAARRGARRLKADISGGGAAALAVMRGLGPTVSVWEEGSSVACTTLPPPPAVEGREEVGPFGSVAGRLGERRAG